MDGVKVFMQNAPKEDINFNQLSKKNCKGKEAKSQGERIIKDLEDKMWLYQLCLLNYTSEIKICLHWQKIKKEEGP